MQEQLNSFHMFTWKVVLLLQKPWHKMIWKNNDDPFSTLLCIGHKTGGPVIWHMCKIPTLLHKGKKTEVILWCGWLFLALLKLIKLYVGRVFPTGGDAVSPPIQPKIYVITH